jgi:hydroxymethylpyrimidine/phosphomethylpyrimidine kinase
MKDLDYPQIKPHLIVNGYVTHDRPTDRNPYHGMGGAVSFASVVAARMGNVGVTAVTRLSPDHPYVDLFQQRGIQEGFHTINLGEGGYFAETNITSFTNMIVGAHGERKQLQPTALPGQTAQDARRIGRLLQEDTPTVLMMGTVTAGEVSKEFLQTVAEMKGKNPLFTTTLLPQGLVRKVDPDTKIVTHNGDSLPWLHDHNLLAVAVDQMVLSKEDLEGMSEGYEQFLAQQCKLVVVTRGGNGVSIYQKGERYDQPAFALTDEEIRKETKQGCWTGAGDTFATGVQIGLLSGLSIFEAAREAQLLTACKISANYWGDKEDGLDSIPTQKEYEAWLEENHTRVIDYEKQTQFLDFQI